MKARLIYSNNAIQLLLCTGKILNITHEEATTFLLNFSDDKYYDSLSKWDYESLTMEEYPGQTIAIVDDADVLHVENANLFRSIFEKKSVKYLTAPEYAAKYGKKSAIIRRFCLQNRFPGAILKGRVWLIPEDCPYPKDERCN